MPQLGQRIAADHRRQQQPVGFQRPANLRQHAGQIVDELKGEPGDDEIERLRLERQSFLFGIIQTYLGNGLEAIARRRSQHRARRPDLRDLSKIPQHRVQAFFHVFSDAVEQERGGLLLQCTALPHPQQGTVEQFWRGIWAWGHAGWYAGLPISGNPAAPGARARGCENYRENRPPDFNSMIPNRV